jgi:1,4-alpha-glucan branching enzyme
MTQPDKAQADKAQADKTQADKTQADVTQPPAPRAPAPPAPTPPAPTPAEVSPGEIERVVAGQHHDPHSILGSHPGPGGTTIRALRPMATTVTLVLEDGQRLPMEHVHKGVWSVTVPDEKAPAYKIATSYTATGDDETVTEDAYRFLPTIGEFDQYLIGEGRHEELWRVLGAHVREVNGVTGTSFAVWAPSAHGVRVTGDFNFWDSIAFPMRSLGGSGVWELFVPGIGDGTRYKYAICGPDGVWREKADPMANATEKPPATASVVYTSHYTWQDTGWMAERPSKQLVREPMSIYEVHLGSWRPGLSYEELATQLVDYVTDLGFTHVEFLPVAEHPFGGSWGYQVTSFYAPTSRFGRPDDLRHLIDALHQAGIGVIMDWVPGHFPRDEWALAQFDGTALYEHPDPRRGTQPDWGTLVFNFGRTEVRNFLVANALYWLEEFHADGLRVDAVASMLYLDYSREDGEWSPNQYGGRENLDAIAFLQEVNATAYKRNPGVTVIAEESTAWPGVTRPVYLGGLGFGFKWNMGWMHDTLNYLSLDPIYRQYHHNEMTFSMVYAYTENFVLPLSHDEVVHGKGSLLGKMPGDEWRKFAGLRTLLAYMWAHPGKQLLFMGSEFGQGHEWSDEGLDWWLLDFDVHQGVQRLSRDLNEIYRKTPALWQLDTQPEGFSWIDANDAQGNTLSFIRFAAKPGTSEPGSAVATQADPAGMIACIANFSALPHLDYRVGLPQAGRWREVLNTDAAVYGGSGVGNMGGIEAVAEPWHGRPASALVTVPPLGVLWLTPESDGADGDTKS